MPRPLIFLVRDLIVNKTMKYFSMFTGVGGFELGVNKVYEQISSIKDKEQGVQGTRDSSGLFSELNNNNTDRFTCVGFSEIDKYCNQLLQIKWPETKNYGDATKIDTRQLPDFDLLVGGFPCQSFSIAGKRKGFDDTRGTLFFDVARILADKKPRYVVLENVKGLLSHDGGRTFTTIIRVLSDLGYFVEWQVLNSKNFGVPQNRERVFIIGHLGGQPRQKVFPIRENNSEDIILPTITARITADSNGTYVGKRQAQEIIQINNPTHSNDRVYGGKGISPTLNTMQGGRRQMVKIPEATKKGYAEATVGQAINLAVPNSKTRRGRVSDIAQTVDTGMQQHTLTSEMRIRRLTPLECERLQGFPDNWTKDFSDTQRYKMMGNAVTVNVVEYVMSKLLKQ